jgi:CxxC motif-containing protein (DUF1111 family)
VSGLDGNMLSYDADAGRIIVQPFGWKGRQATIQGFLGGGFRVHFGLQWETPIAKYCALDSVEPEQKRNFERTWGKGACHDPDEDGVSGEVSDGQLAAISVYLMKIDPPAPAPHEHRGREVFRAVGCSACHTRGFALASSVDRSLDVDVTLPVRDDGAEVEVWSDFRRHEMAFAGGDYHEFPNEPTTIDAYSFVTPPLWDIAATAPYMHDGRAATLEEAILAHDDDEHSSEAKDSVDQFKALPADDKQALLDFLGTLGKEFVGASDR